MKTHQTVYHRCVEGFRESIVSNLSEIGARRPVTPVKFLTLSNVLELPIRDHPNYATYNSST